MQLAYDSPCIDDGNPSDPDDPDGTDPDMGAVYRPHESITSATTISTSDTWSAYTTYQVSADVTVSSTATLTVEEGVAVELTNGKKISVGSSATLDVNGTSSDGGVIFDGDDATTNGVGIRVEGNAYIEYATIKNMNSGSLYGGGLYGYYAALDLDHVTITNCETGSGSIGGGGMYASFSLVYLDDVTITNCTAAGNNSLGGGLFLLYGTATLDDLYISGCESSLGGGAYLSVGSGPTVTNSVFTGNTAFAGGGIYIAAYGASAAELVSCEISGNATEDGFGGGVYTRKELDMELCVVTDNECTDLYWGEGGGVYYTYGSGTSTVDYCTIANNNAASSGTRGGGLHLDEDGGVYPTVTVSNSILWDNSPTEIVTEGSASCTVTYSCVEGGGTDDGNINSDPCFANAASGDYSLQAESPYSPCIDAADPSGAYDDMGAIQTSAKPARDLASALPAAFSVDQNAPNPFNPSTTIRYALPAPGNVRLAVYTIAGQLVTELVNEERGAGYHEVVWDGIDRNGRPASSGIYVYRLVSDQGVVARRMTLVR